MSDQSATSNETYIDVCFEHIYNGLIISDCRVIPMIEFKIKSKKLNPVVSITPLTPLTDEELKTDTTSKDTTDLKTEIIKPTPNILFKYVDFKCAWFIVDVSESHRQLIGPVGIDGEKIKDGIRVVNDNTFQDIDGLEISSVSNNIDDLIAKEDIPEWMMIHLRSSIYLEK